VAAKNSTSTIPIVFAAAGDPVGNNLVASLARPGGNVTGLSIQSPDVAGKRLEFLREVVPGLRRLAFLVNMNNPGAAPELGEVQIAAKTFGIEVDTLEIRRPDDIGPALATVKGDVGWSVCFGGTADDQQRAFDRSLRASSEIADDVRQRSNGPDRRLDVLCAALP